MIIQVKDGEVVSAEYNGKNESGFIKAWDNTYIKNMMSKQGTYPNKYTREYVQQLMNEQTEITVDAVTGASHSGANFEKLAPAVLEQVTNIIILSATCSPQFPAERLFPYYYNNPFVLVGSYPLLHNNCTHAAYEYLQS